MRCAASDDAVQDIISSLQRVLNPELASGPTRAVIIAALKKLGDAAVAAKAEEHRVVANPKLIEDVSTQRLRCLYGCVQLESDIIRQKKYKPAEVAAASFNGQWLARGSS